MTDQTSGRNRTHTFDARIGEMMGDGLRDVEVILTCHNDPTDVHRDCKFTESEPVEDCPHRDNNYPKTCGGWTGPDGSHLHPDEGCGVEWTRRYVGDEVVAAEAAIAAGEGFTVWWEEGCPVLRPSTPVQPTPEDAS